MKDLATTSLINLYFLSFFGYKSIGANVQKGKFLETPLHAAARQSSAEIVNMLLEFGADINAKNTEFERPVDVASPRSLVERVLFLHEGKWEVYLSVCLLYSVYYAS